MDVLPENPPIYRPGTKKVTISDLGSTVASNLFDEFPDTIGPIPRRFLFAEEDAMIGPRNHELLEVVEYLAVLPIPFAFHDKRHVQNEFVLIQFSPAEVIEPFAIIVVLTATHRKAEFLSDTADRLFDRASVFFTPLSRITPGVDGYVKIAKRINYILFDIIQGKFPKLECFFQHDRFPCDKSICA
jgi:hypothetical protein